MDFRILQSWSLKENPGMHSSSLPLDGKVLGIKRTMQISHTKSHFISATCTTAIYIFVISNIRAHLYICFQLLHDNYITCSALFDVPIELKLVF